MIDKFNEYIQNMDREIVYMNLKRALMYMFTRCVIMFDDEAVKGDEVILKSNNDNFKLTLKLVVKDEKETEYWLYCNIHGKDIKLLACNLMPSNKVFIYYYCMADRYEYFTDEEYLFINNVLKEYINSYEDDTPFDLFHSLIVLNEDDAYDS